VAVTWLGGLAYAVGGPTPPPNHGEPIMADILDGLFENHQEGEDESDLPVITDLAKKCPVLHDFVRFTKWKGSSVEPPKLGYGLHQGKLYVSLTDTERRRSLRVECATFIGGCIKIENHIAQGALASLWYWWPTKGKTPRKKPAG